MAVVNPKEIHACNRWCDGCQAICMIVDQRQLHTNSLSSLRFDNKITANDKIPRIMDDLLALLLSEACEYEKDCRINALMYTLLAEIIKYSSAKDAKIRINYDLSAVFDHIEQNLADKLTLGDLAEILHLSSDRFYHVFKEQTGISPTDYIISRRIEQSCSYLESTDMSISEIAQKCNFCTSSYFSKTFREYMGVTPKEYRKSSSVQLNIK
jgi:AraC-like DNA-binding protein